MSVTDLTRGIYRRVYSNFIFGHRINRVTVGAEAAFWRLHAVCDDFGSFPADLDLLVQAAWPRRRATKRQIEKWLDELAEHDLIEIYEDGGDRYGRITDFLRLQPASRNGRRVQRYPMPPELPRGNPGESRGIRGNPGEPCSSIHAHSETETEEHSQSNHRKTTGGVGFLRKRRATEGPFDQSAQENLSDSDSTDPRTRRLQARSRYLLSVSKIWSADATQGRADRTATEASFDDLIWPEDMDGEQGAVRLARASGMLRQARRNGRNKMAYLTELLKGLDA